MGRKLECIPIKIEQNIISSYENQGKLYFKSKLHPELKTLELNKISKLILDLSDNKYNIYEIIEIISKRYNKVDIETLRDDILDILLRFWKLGIITWQDRNPYDDMFNYEYNGVEAHIMTEDEVIKELTIIDNIHYNPYYSKMFQINESNIRKKVYSGVEHFTKIKNNDFKFMFSFTFKGLKSRSCFLNIYNIPKLYSYNIGEIKHILSWSIKKYEEIIKYKFKRIDIALVKELYTEIEHKNLSLMLKELGFQNSGCLEKSFKQHEKYFDINLFSFDL